MNPDCFISVLYWICNVISSGFLNHFSIYYEAMVCWWIFIYSNLSLIILLHYYYYYYYYNFYIIILYLLYYRLSFVMLLWLSRYLFCCSYSHNVAPKGKFIAFVSTEAETDHPETELKPGIDLLGPVEEIFFDIYDRYEPVNEPSLDNCFISTVSHFQVLACSVYSSLLLMHTWCMPSYV